MSVGPQTNLRTETSRDERHKMLEAMGNYLAPIVAEALRSATRTCLTCDHFNEPGELCKLYNARPPARVIAFGCPSYQDEIPF